MNSHFPARAEAALRRFVAPHFQNHTLIDRACLHALSGGKRLRPALVFSQPHGPDILAAAIECAHLYSLIHDDCPMMDNASIRHGAIATHRRYGENIAVLAGNAFQVLSFELCKDYPKAIPLLAEALGNQGLLLGQTWDLYPKTHTIEHYKQLYRLKSGSLFASATQFGLIDQPETFEAAKQFGHHLGIAFQIQDDFLDQSTSLNKDTHQDTHNFLSLVSHQEATKHMNEHFQQALEWAHQLPGHLDHIVELIQERTL